MPDPHQLADYAFHFMQKWSTAISNPRFFLAPLFHPKDDVTINAVEFYFATLTVAFSILAPFVLGQKGEEKARLAASSIVGFVSGAVIAMTWHLAFSWLGGGANFAGTCVGYIYSGAPFVPLFALSSLLTFAALPSDLQHYALSPATAEKAFQRGMKDPRTSKGLVVVGTLSSFCLVVWSFIVQLRTMSFVHRLTGMRAAFAIVLAIFLAALVAPLLKAIASVFNPPAEGTLDDKPEIAQLEPDDVSVSRQAVLSPSAELPQ